MRLTPRIALCAFVILLLAAAGHAQAPNSGAMLTISGNVGATPVNIMIYDSQIHSGTVQTNPCDPSGFNRTDAYVLQGGSTTGCDTGDAYEVTESNNPNAGHQVFGQTDITKSAGPGSALLPGAGFHIETHYICGRAFDVGGCEAGEGSFCNSSESICTSGDTGFIFVTNNTGVGFSGTIMLQGDSTGCGSLSDSSTNLAATSQVILALGSPTIAIDSSNCGGFNHDQQQTITALNPSAVFLFGEDKFTVNPSNIVLGDTLTFRPVPMPVAQFNQPGLILGGNGSLFGNGTQCVSIRDFAANGNPVCPEFQTQCLNDGPCGDAETFFWTGEFDAHLDPNAGYPTVSGVTEIGGVHFLGHPAVSCPVNTFSEDIVISYTGDTPGDLPLKPGGSGLNCFVSSFDPTQPAVGPGVTVKAFDGFFTPVSDTELNVVQVGRTVPLKFFVSNGAGGPGITNLQLCNNNTASGSTCPGVALGLPWVLIAMTQPASCSAADTAAGINTTADDTLLTTSGLKNLGGGNYLLTWKIPKSTPLNTCTSINVQLSSGAVLIDVANFKFGNQ